MSNFWGAVHFELNSIHLVRLSYKTRQRCKAIFHFLSESGFGDLKNGGKTNWNPLKKGFFRRGSKNRCIFGATFGIQKEPQAFVYQRLAAFFLR